MRYFKCQDFGHMAVICKKSCRCDCFGGVLEFGKCIVGVNWKCCNCRANHSVAFWGYEVVKRELKKMLHPSGCMEQRANEGKKTAGSKEGNEKI